MKGIADTSFLVAFANRNDRFHGWAASLAGEVSAHLLTCEAVLAETASQLRNSALVLAMIEQGLISVAFDCAEHLAELSALARRYADRQPDLADLCLIRRSEIHPRHRVITVDREDFRVYRRNRRQMIPLICPPEG